MKKKIKRALISALTLSLAMGAAGIAPRVRAEENFSNLASVAAVNERKNAYTVMNHYKYRMEKAFERLLDTFEAWINVREGSLGVTIMGNLFYDSLQYEGTIEWDTTKPNGTPRKLLDISKATALGWTYKTELEEGIRLSYEDFRNNPMRVER